MVEYNITDAEQRVNICLKADAVGAPTVYINGIAVCYFEQSGVLVLYDKSPSEVKKLRAVGIAFNDNEIKHY